MEEKSSTPYFSQPEPVPAADALAPSSTGGAFPALSVWAKLWRGKWLVLFTIAGFTLVALMLGGLRTPLYSAQVSIGIQSPTNHGSQHAKFAYDSGSSLESFVQTQAHIIQSRSLTERALGKLPESERARLLEPPHFWGQQNAYDRNLGSFRSHLSVRPSDQASILDVSLLSPDASAGAHFLNVLAQELADFNVERSWRSSQHNREWTDRQLQDLRRRWEQSERVLAEFSQSQAAQVASVPRSFQPVIGEANDVRLRQLKSRRAALDKERTQWEALYGPSTPTTAKLRTEAAATDAAIRQRRAAMQKTAAAGAQPGPVAVNQSTSTQGTSNQKLANQSIPGQSIVSRAEAIARLNVLKQEAETNGRIYENSAARLQDANVTTAAGVGDIFTFDPAVPDGKSATPGSLIEGLLGALTGLLIGIAFVTLQERFSPTFPDAELLSRYLTLPVLGVIPGNRFAGLPKPAFSNAETEPILQLAFDTDEEIAEAYRSIRSSILYKAGQRSGPRRLVFTSAGEAEGKTSVVGNLGAAIASAQRRVLLIDGDLRNPGLHKFFGAGNEHGLADLLSRQLTASPIASRDVIRETQIPDLYLLTAGQAGLRAPEILSSAQLPQLIREFAKGFDIVLIDSAQVLPYSDTRSLARAADGVVLVVRAATTERRSALLARDSIMQDGVPVVGTILTDWDRSRSSAAGA